MLTPHRLINLVALICLASLTFSVGCGPSGTTTTTVDRQNSPVDHAQPTDTVTVDTATNTTGADHAAPPSDEAGWGHLHGTFVYDGDAPASTRLIVDKDIQVCGKHDLRDESLLVNAANRGLANVVVYLYVKRGDATPQTHPSYAETALANVPLNNENCRFAPHVCLLRTTQTLVVGNKDVVGHNTKVDTRENPSINPITPAGETLEHQFSHPERSPVMVRCSIHSWMSAYLLVRDNPYFAVTDENGQFEIKNLPAGQWTFQVWQEKAQFISTVNQGGNETSWRRGRFEVQIEADNTVDLGQIKVSPDAF